MTAPDVGGRTFTLTPGKAARLLTQYARGDDQPLLIISGDVAGSRVYIGADSSVSPGNGVPLDPGTSLPWTTPGTVYAIADPAGTANATLTITAAISDWQPSPAAIAAEVAAQLLAQGVPNVLTSEVITAPIGDTLASGASKTYDVSGFASLIIQITAASGAAGGPVQLVQIPPAGGNSSVDLLYCPPGVENSASAVVQVLGGQLFVLNQAAGGMTLFITGTNRPVLRRFDVSNAAFLGDIWTVSNPGPVASGQVFPMSRGNPAPVQLVGAATMYLRCGSAPPGRFELVVPSVPGTASQAPIWMADTAEMVTSSSTSLILVRQVALPGEPYTIQFRATAAAAGALGFASLYLVPHNP